MKKIISLVVILPAVFLAMGYGAGAYLNKPLLEDAEIAAGPDETHASEEGSLHETGNDADENESAHSESNKLIVVKLGQMIIPVYKAQSITYIVTSLGITVSDLKSAEYYNLGENGTKLRDAIFAELKQSADGRALRGVSIDTEKLARDITENVQPKFSGVSDVLFLSFYKRDVARS